MRRTVLSLIVCAAAVAGSACFDFSTKATPALSASNSLGGSWATTQSLPGASGSLNDSCVDFKWAVTQFSGTSGSGTFSATCMGNVKVTGTASASLTTATSATWSANAQGAAPGQPPCQVAISGTATLEADNRIKIPYSGTTCLGPVSGTEIIQR